MHEDLLTTNQAAERLGVTTARVRAMIKAKRLHAEKFGHVHMIRVEDLEKLPAVRKPGRPKKQPEQPLKSAA